MSIFSRKNHVLYMEDVALPDIAACVATPFYLYSARALRENYRTFAAASGARATIAYAVKANGNQAVLRCLALEGAGADIVSEGEGRRALAAGINANKIFFSGAGKTGEELRFALKHKIAQINVESEGELRRLEALAAQMNCRAPIALRVNPNIAAGAHDKISTGRAGDKFGIAFDDVQTLYRAAHQSRWFNLHGLAMHIGSQISDVDVFARAFARIGELTMSLRAAGLTVQRIDLGGGLGIEGPQSLDKHIQNYGRLAEQFSQEFDCDVVLAPGRALVGVSGCLVASVIEDKTAGDSNFLIIDAAMNDFLRPALYEARHQVEPVIKEDEDRQKKIYQIVGAVCETGDIIARDMPLAPQKSGALIAIMQAGAYGAVLASNYNGRLLIPEIMVQGSRFAVIRPRLDYQQMIKLDCVPHWLEKEQKPVQ